MAKYDDLNNKQIFTIGIGSVVVTAVTILAVLYVYYLLVDAHQAQLQAESSYRRQNTILTQQASEVSVYGADPTTGNVTIPVEKAMEIIIAEQDTGAETESDPNASTKTEQQSDIQPRLSIHAHRIRDRLAGVRHDSSRTGRCQGRVGCQFERRFAARGARDHGRAKAGRIPAAELAAD